jgi:aryl-alcohol dehydrogenase-like predicted oxidoreductase
MKPILLFPGAAASSSLGFGTTSLMGVPTTRERLALLESAFEAGIRHFDTAPSYGHGESERVLGDFIAGKREQLTITTKFGIQAPAMVKSRLVNLMARRILRLLPGLRKALARKAVALSHKGDFTPAAARRSLDQSLIALKTDHVDLLLLHEPGLADAASVEMHEHLEAEVKRGRIRAYGCGGEIAAIQQIADAKLPTARWLQFEDNVLSRRIEGIRSTGARCITYRTFNQALPWLANWLAADPGRKAGWNRELQLNLDEAGVLAGLMQAASHRRNPDGMVLFSSSRAENIRAAVRIASGTVFSTGQLEKFEELTRHVPLAAPDAG